MFANSSIRHFHYDIFSAVITSMIRERYSYIKGKNCGKCLFFTFKIQPYNYVMPYFVTCTLQHINFFIDMYFIDIFVNCNWVVTRWQKYSTHLHTNNTYNDTKQRIIEQHNNWMGAGRAPSWLVLPWHFPYKRGKSTEKPQSG